MAIKEARIDALKLGLVLCFASQMGCLKLREESWHKPAAAGDIPAMEKLIEGGVSVNSSDENGDTPLTYALSYKHFDLAEFLLTKGAKADTKNRSGKKPSEAADSTNGNKQATEWMKLYWEKQ